VSLTDPKGVRHAVDVTAESLHEAAAMALVVYKQNGWTDPVGSAARLEVEVREPAVKAHWLGDADSPMAPGRDEQSD
jgi:hypothetical protein